MKSFLKALDQRPELPLVKSFALELGVALGRVHEPQADLHEDADELDAIGERLSDDVQSAPFHLLSTAAWAFADSPVEPGEEVPARGRRRHTVDDVGRAIGQALASFDPRAAQKQIGRLKRCKNAKAGTAATKVADTLVGAFHAELRYAVDELVARHREDWAPYLQALVLLLPAPLPVSQLEERFNPLANSDWPEFPDLKQLTKDGLVTSTRAGWSLTDAGRHQVSAMVHSERRAALSAYGDH